LGSITLFKQLSAQLTRARRGLVIGQLINAKPTRPAQLSAPSKGRSGEEEGAQDVLEALALLSAPPSSSPELAGGAQGQQGLRDEHGQREASALLEGVGRLDNQRPDASQETEGPSLASELEALIQLDQAPKEPDQSVSSPLERGRSATVLLSAGTQHLSVRASAWEVLCVTLKLAKVLPKDRCLRLAKEGGSLSVLELQQVRQHAEHVLLKSMERGDYLFADLSLSDLDPQEAFKEGDPRREEHLDRASLTQLTRFAMDARTAVMVRRLQWRQLGGPTQTGDPDALQRAKRAQR